MSDSKWSVSKYAGSHVRLEPRGTSGTVLRPLEFDAMQPLDSGVQARLIADVGERMKPALASHGDIQRYVALRKKLAIVQRQQQDAELLAKQKDAERQRLTLAEYTAEQPAQLLQLGAEIRSANHSAASLGGLAKSVETELARAKTLAERALKQAVSTEVSAAIERNCEARDRLLQELCEIAGGKLDEIAANVQKLSQLARGPDGLFLLMRGMLDSIELPADAPKDAAPLPPPEPPAPRADASPVLTVLPTGMQQMTLPPDQPNYQVQFAAAPAPSPQPPVSEEPTASEDDPAETRAKGKRRAAKV